MQLVRHLRIGITDYGLLGRLCLTYYLVYFMVVIKNKLVNSMIKETFSLQNPWRTGQKMPFDLIKRAALDIVEKNLSSKKMLGLIGSRQVGKSSLLYLTIAHLLKGGVEAERVYYFNLDDLKLHELFQHPSEIIQFIKPGQTRKYLLVDEIQRLANPGLFLKEIHDLGLNLKIIYSGSSQLEIKSKLKEHLVGRARQLEIQRLSFVEYLRFNDPMTRDQALSEMLIYGSYPEVALERGSIEKQLLIKDIYQGYVEKDLVDFLRIDNVEAFNRLLVLLSNQIGCLLNIDSLSKALRVSRNVVEKYLFVLENTFIIKRIYPFFKNYKKEITKTPKVYFMDLGLRNYVINNFNPLPMRNDQGNLFENFYLLELLAADPYGQRKINHWRTTNQTEIDFLISRGNAVEAIEVKWEKTTPPKSFKTLKSYYPEISCRVASKSDFLQSNKI